MQLAANFYGAQINSSKRIGVHSLKYPTAAFVFDAA
jgi:hypothetical protein